MTAVLRDHRLCSCPELLRVRHDTSKREECCSASKCALSQSHPHSVLRCASLSSQARRQVRVAKSEILMVIADWWQSANYESDRPIMHTQMNVPARLIGPIVSHRTYNNLIWQCTCQQRLYNILYDVQRTRPTTYIQSVGLRHTR